MAQLSHLDEQGRARMVDVSEKEVTSRIAIACGTIHMLPETLALILGDKIEKGDVFSVARVAGIMAAKKTSELIPMCHPLNITSVDNRSHAGAKIPPGSTSKPRCASAARPASRWKP